MGCNCGGGSKGTPNTGNKAASGKKYALTQPDGSRSFYDTEADARAANAKLGGKGLVRRIG